MNRPLQHTLHTRLELAAQTLDLPLNALQLEHLAAELTPVVRCLLAEQASETAANAPVAYAVVGPGPYEQEQSGVRTTTYAQCTSRIGTDVDEGAPAAVLAAEFRRRQPDVIATNVPTPTYLELTVRPRSTHAWRWWLDRFGIAVGNVDLQGGAAYAVGLAGDVAVGVCGLGVPMLMADASAARLARLLAETGPVQGQS